MRIGSLTMRSDVPRLQQVKQKAVGRAEESRTTITNADSND
jgi:hypothetical protein